MDIQSKYNVGDKIYGIVSDYDGVRIVSGTIDNFYANVDKDGVRFNYYVGSASFKEQNVFTTKQELLDTLSASCEEPKSE